MKFIDISYENFLESCKNKKIIQFGASSAWHYYLKIFPNIMSEIINNTIVIVDNDIQKQEKDFKIADKEFKIKSPEIIKKQNDYIVLITVSLAYQEKICEQLINLRLPENIECYSLPLMIYNCKKTDNTCVEKYFNVHTDLLNKPIIHSFWFSGEEKPDLYKRCIESWYKYCPDFKIMEWNSENYDVTKNIYMREAFEHRKWAFVSDYARLDILYQYGGIYMDMDVELINSLTPLLNAQSFFCRQEDGMIELGSGFGVQAGDSLIGEMLATYKNRKLILKNGEMDKTPQPEWLDDVLKKNGFYKSYDSQVVGNRLILSNDYITCFTGENSVQKAKFGIHWHNGGWLDEKDRQLIKNSFNAKEKVLEKYFRKG